MTMGFLDGAKAQLSGQKALRAHVAANDLAKNGKVAEANEKYRQALKLYEAAMAGGQQRANVRQGYAILLMRLGDFERAMAVMEEIRRLRDLTESDWFELRMNYSICLWRMGRLDDAIDTGRRAMQMRKCAAIYSTLGMYLVEKAALTGDFTEAEAFNRESMDYDDADAGIVDNMGAMYEAMADRAGDAEMRAEYRKKAKDHYTRAHAIKPRQIVTMYNLARMQHADGEDAQARKTLEPAENLCYSAVGTVTEAMMEDLKRAVELCV